MGYCKISGVVSRVSQFDQTPKNRQISSKETSHRSLRPKFSTPEKKKGCYEFSGNRYSLKMTTKSFELVITSESKPFPWGPLATAIYINSTCDGNPITITTQAVALLEPAMQASNVKLVSKSE
jgi:hypothetical protein